MSVRGIPSAEPSRASRWTIGEGLTVAALLLSSVGVQIYLIATHRIPSNSDQALVGLMARHILQGRGHPVFFYGSTYAGTFEAHLCALTFAVFGSTMQVYRATMVLLLLLLTVGVYLLTRYCFGRSAGLWTLAVLSLGPFFFFYKGLTSDGHYNGLALTTVALMGCALLIERGPRQGLRGRSAAFGIAVGLGLWISPVSVPLSAAAVLWLLIYARQRSSSFLFPAILGVVVGSFPWWFWNSRHHWASLTASDLARATPAVALEQLGAILTRSIPVAAGAAAVKQEVFRPVYPGAPIVIWAAWLFFLVALASKELRSNRRVWLFGLASAALIGTAALSTRLVPNEPRFLFPLYALMPPLLGLSLQAKTAKRVGIVVAASLAALFATQIASNVTAQQYFRNSDTQVTASLTNLIRTLESEGSAYVYSNYWTAYRLSFESQERIIATPLPGDEMIRYEPYREQVDRALHPAVVLLSERDACFEKFLREHELSHQRTAIEDFGVYTNLDPRALTTLRAGLGLPLPSEAYRVSWRLNPQPSTLMAGESRVVRVEVRNEGPCVWPISVHLGYHWWPASPRALPTYDGPRGFLSNVVRPGEDATFAVRLLAPKTPGQYRLEYDLVHENIEWFSHRGGQTASVEVMVLAGSGASE